MAPISNYINADDIYSLEQSDFESTLSLSGPLIKALMNYAPGSSRLSYEQSVAFNLLLRWFYSEGNTLTKDMKWDLKVQIPEFARRLGITETGARRLLEKISGKQWIKRSRGHVQFNQKLFFTTIKTAQQQNVRFSKENAKEITKTELSNNGEVTYGFNERSRLN